MHRYIPYCYNQDGVEGVIIRLGYGWGNNADKKAQRNISECKKLGIPFGIYWYSYADTPSIAKEEGTDVVAKLWLEAAVVAVP